MGRRCLVALSIVLLLVVAAEGFTSTASAASPAVSAASSSRAQALAALRTAATNLHSAADDIVESPGGLISNLRWQFALGEMRGAIRDARRLGLASAVKTYSAMLMRESARVDFAHFVNRAERYGDDVAQRAHEDNPQLTPGQLGTIASNATAWYGNSAVQRNLLASARKDGKKTYEVTVKPGQDLDAAAYKIYRGLSVGARRTNIRYSGRR